MNTKDISIITWGGVLVGLMRLITYLQQPPTYRADTIHQVQNISRHCSQELGGTPVVETLWEKTSDTTRRPNGWEITCHKE